MYKNLSTGGLGITGHQSEIIELALSFGFQGMDLDMTEFTEQVKLYGLSHARRLIDSARIRLGQFRLPIAWDEENDEDASFEADVDQFAGIVETAAEIGLQRCVTGVRPASDQRPYHENFEFHRKRLTRIAEVLQPKGIQLGLEFSAVPELRKGRAFQFIHSFDALVQLAKAVSTGNVGVVIDLWHLHVAGNKVEECQVIGASGVVGVYLSDVPKDANLETIDESARLMPGDTGVIDVNAALLALAEMEFTGPVSVRASRAALGDQGRDAVVRAVGKRLSEIWKAAGLSTGRRLSVSS